MSSRYDESKPDLENRERISRLKKRHLKRKKRNRLLKTVFFIVILLGIAAGCLIFFKGDEIKGTWVVDDITSYKFNGDGKGSMILPLAQFDFEYELNEDQLSIDFESEKAIDSVYKFSVEGDVLTLIYEIEGKEPATIIMDKR